MASNPPPAPKVGSPGEPVSEPVTSAPIRHLEFKAALLLAFTAMLVFGYIGYVLYARGVFDSTQRLVLVTDNSEGIYIGMDLTFAGFPIGRVRRIELGPDGKARINIAVPIRDARWLRASSVFTMERALVGGTRIRAFTGQLDDAQLPDGAVRPVLRGDATDELPRLLASVKDVLENVQKLTATDSSLAASLANVRVVTERMAGRGGLLAGTLGSEENATKVVAALDRANRLLDSLAAASARLDQVLVKADQAMVKADQRVFGRDGVMDETQKAVAQLNAALGDARESLKKADAVLADAQKISASAKGATDDLAGLRAEVDASLRKVGALIDEIDRKWPFKRDTEVKLP